MRRAAVVPTPPLLVPEIAGGSAPRHRALLAACDEAVSSLRGAREVVVVGHAPTTGSCEGSWDWRGFGVPSPTHPVDEPLPLALAVGAWLLDRAGWDGPRHYLGVGTTVAPEECARLGRGLGPDAAVLACGDGAAALDEKAPGHLHPRAGAWEHDSVAALRSGDPAAVLALDPALAQEVHAAGRAAWQVMAGAAGEPRRAAWLHSEAPHGVAYHVVTWA